LFLPIGKYLIITLVNTERCRGADAVLMMIITVEIHIQEGDFLDALPKVQAPKNIFTDIPHGKIDFVVDQKLSSH
jgi:hypothetical protein